jgi:hypothetical protein
MHSDIVTILADYIAYKSYDRLYNIYDIPNIYNFILPNLKNNDTILTLINKYGKDITYRLCYYNLYSILHISCKYLAYKYPDDDFEWQIFNYRLKIYHGKIISRQYNYYTGHFVNEFGNIYSDRIIYESASNRFIIDRTTRQLRNYVTPNYEYDIRTIKYKIGDYVYKLHYSKCIITKDKLHIINIDIKNMILTIHIHIAYRAIIPIIAGIIYYIGTNIPLFDMNKMEFYRLCGSRL